MPCRRWGSNEGQQCNKTYIPWGSTTEKQPEHSNGFTSTHADADGKLSVLLILRYNGATSLLPDPQLPTIHLIKGLASMAALPPHGQWALVLMQLKVAQTLVIDLNSHCSDGLKSSLNQPRLSWPLSSCWRWRAPSSQVGNEVPVLRLTHCSQIATWHGAAGTDCLPTCVHSALPDLDTTASRHRDIYHMTVREKEFHWDEAR